MTGLITRPLGEGIKRLWSLDEIPKKDGHILSPDIVEGGGVLTLPFEIKNIRNIQTRRLHYPPQKPEIVSDRIMLNDIQLAMERVLQGLVQYMSDPDEGNEGILRLLVLRYQDTLMDALMGKAGLLERHIYSLRCEMSCRGVIAYCPEVAHDEVALPARIAERFHNEFIAMAKKSSLTAEETERPWIVILRHPALHGPGIRKMYFQSWDEEAIGLNPAITLGQNADFDGDWEFAILGTPRIPIEEDFTDCKWDHELLLAGPSDIDFRDSSEDLAKRIDTPDFGLGPEDVLVPGEVLARLSKCKELKIDDITAWADGMSAETVAKEDFDVATAVAIQKTGVGRIGNISKMTRLASNQDKALAKSAAHICERATQELMDSKHKMSDNYRIIIEMFDGVIGVNEAETLLYKAKALDPKLAQPFLDKLRELHAMGWLLKDLVSDRFPAYEATSRATQMAVSGIAGFEAKKEILNKLVEQKASGNAIIDDLGERVKHGEHFLAPRPAPEAGEETEPAIPIAGLRGDERDGKDGGADGGRDGVPQEQEGHDIDAKVRDPDAG